MHHRPQNQPRPRAFHRRKFRRLGRNAVVERRIGHGGAIAIGGQMHRHLHRVAVGIDVLAVDHIELLRGIRRSFGGLRLRRLHPGQRVELIAVGQLRRHLGRDAFVDEARVRALPTFLPTQRRGHGAAQRPAEEVRRRILAELRIHAQGHDAIDEGFGRDAVPVETLAVEVAFAGVGGVDAAVETIANGRGRKVRPA